MQVILDNSGNLFGFGVEPCAQTLRCSFLLVFKYSQVTKGNKSPKNNSKSVKNSLKDNWDLIVCIFWLFIFLTEIPFNSLPIFVLLECVFPISFLFLLPCNIQMCVNFVFFNRSSHVFRRLHGGDCGLEHICQS